MKMVAPKVLIFDIGGTVFDWRTAVLKCLEKVATTRNGGSLDREGFAFACRALFMDVNGAVIRGERPWITADEIYSEVVTRLIEQFSLPILPPGDMERLRLAWRSMPAWPDAPAAIARLRRHFVVVPLTILSWSMAVGSSRRNGIDWDGLLSCDLLGVYKPDPRCFERASQVLQVKPCEITMVASHPSDLRAGKLAGYSTAYVRPRLEDPGEDYTDTGFESEFDLIASDFDDLAAQLISLSRFSASDEQIGCSRGFDE